MRTTKALCALLAVAATAAVYWPLPRVYFWSDDFVCLLTIADQGFVRFVLQVFGGHILLVRNLVFYLSYALFGFHPEPYYSTVLLMHLVNVWLLFRVVHAVTDDGALACLGAAAWGTCPLLAGTLGWYAVFGHVLATTVMLLVLGALARVAPRGAIGPSTIAGWAALLLIGATCFGVGIGVALAFPVVFVLFAPSTLRDRRVLAIVLGLPPAVVGLYFGYRRLSAMIDPLPLSEAILFHLAISHVAPIFTLLGHMLAFGTTGLLLGFFFVPKAYPGVQSQIAVAGTIVTTIAVCCISDAALRRRCVALFALCTGAFAVIALGRANLYSAEHFSVQAQANQLRYYYAALAPLAVLFSIVLDRARRGFGVPGAAILAAWVAIAGVGFVRSRWSIDERPIVRAYTERTCQSMDAAIDAAPTGADVHLPNRRVIPPLLGVVLGPKDFPGSVGFFVLRHPENVVHGHRVFFVETDPVLLSAFRVPAKHHRLSELLVPPAP